MTQKVDTLWSQPGGKEMDRRTFIVLNTWAWPLVARTQELPAPPRECTSTGTLYVGWYELHPDVSLNFQLNRWAATGGPEWIADVRPELASLRDYDSWRNTFIRLGETAAEQGRTLHAALHFRCAEFFMVPSDSNANNFNLIRGHPLRQHPVFYWRSLGTPAACYPHHA